MVIEYLSDRVIVTK